MFRGFSFFLALIVGIPVYGQEIISEEAAVDLLVGEFGKQVKITNRPITMFRYKDHHYFLKQIGPLPSQDSTNLPLGGKRNPVARDYRYRILNHLKSKTSIFWNPDLDHLQKEGMVGSGVYFARDLFQSASYGGKTFGLIVLDLPVGSRILDVRMESPEYTDPYRRSSNAFYFSDETFQKIKSICPVDPQPWSTGNFVSHLGCVKLLRKALEKLKIDAIVYRYNPSTVPGCEDGSVAFSLIDASRIQVENIFYYSWEYQGNSLELSHQILEERGLRAQFLYWLDQQTTDFSSVEKYWTGLIPLPETNLSAVPEQEVSERPWLRDAFRSYLKWKNENIFGCQDEAFQ